MSYETVLLKELIFSEYLAVWKPRAKVTGWTPSGGVVWQTPFALGGQVVGLTDGGVELTLASLSETFDPLTLSGGEFYYDFRNNILYVRTVLSIDPNTKFMVSTFEVYFGTIDAHANRVPNDSSTRQVYFDPIITVAPSKKQTIKDIIFGFLPPQSSSMSVANTEGIFEKFLNEASLNNIDVDIYHWVDDMSNPDFDSDTVKLKFKSKAKNPKVNDSQITISLYDAVLLLEENLEPSPNRLTTLTFPDLDPLWDNRAIPIVYGVSSGNIPSNIDYDALNPLVTNNRDFVTQKSAATEGSVTTVVPAGPVNTATKTYLGTNPGIQVGDSFFNATLVKSEIVTALGSDGGGDFIEHAALTVAGSGNVINRSYVGAVRIVKDNIAYQAKFGIDYIEASFADGTVGFSFTAALDSGGTPLIPTIFDPIDAVDVRLYGKKNDVTLGGPAFGTNSSVTGNLTDPIVILFDILKTYANITEAEIDTTSFTTLQSALTDEVGLVIPEQSTDAAPQLKVVILRILKSLLLKLYINDENVWTVKQTGPIGASDKSIEDEEIKDGSMTINYDYEDIASEIRVNFNIREIAENFNQFGRSTQSVTTQSDTAKFLHKVTKTRTINSVHFLLVDATRLAKRLGFILGDRDAIYKVSAQNPFFDTEIDNILEINRVQLPDLTYDGTTEISRKVSVTELDQSLPRVLITGRDQRGIEQNAGSW